MFLTSLLAAAFTFTASATGVDKGATVEFLFTGKDSDRDYEAMFALDMPVAEFARAIEKAGLPPGQPIDVEKCRVWPVGTPVSIEPSISDFVTIDKSDGFDLGRIVYTGGLRDTNGVPVASSEMPASVFSLYTLGQSLFLPEMIIGQGDAYGKFSAAKKLEKGAKYAFTIYWNNADAPRHVELHAVPGNSVDLLKRLRDAAASASIDVLVSFDGELTVGEATLFAKALDTVDSIRIKITGCRPGSLFFRAFLPLVKWTERQNRMVQPFELTIHPDRDELVFVDEDWNVEGDDPKLTPVQISFGEAVKKEKTDTCFIFAPRDVKLSRVYAAMEKLKGSKVHNWYVFVR